MSIRQTRRIIPKTANYTVNPAIPDSPGTMFTTRGATGAVTFTLPAPSAALKGWFYDFLNLVDQNMVVSAGSGNGIAFNNAACASLAAQTSSQKIGAQIRATCDGTSWVLAGESNGVTYTVA